MTRTARLSAAVSAAGFRRLLTADPRLLRWLAGPERQHDGEVLSAQSQLMLRLLALAETPAESLPVDRGRIAVRRQAAAVGGRQPIGDVQDRTVPGADGPLPARLYVPTAPSPSERGAAAAAPGPLLIFFHGGGMIYGDLDSHDPLCRLLAETAQVRVLSVGYRLAPEAPFPAGRDDAWAAYAWVSSHGGDLGADPQRIAVGGDSAGGSLAASVALQAAAAGRALTYQLLIYPLTDWAATTPSRALFGEGLFLTTAFIELSRASYLGPGDAPARDDRASVLYAEVPGNTASAYVATAGFDPLRDEGEAYARRMADAGVPVTLRRYGSQTHGFANLLGVDGSARRAVIEMARALGDALHR